MTSAFSRTRVSSPNYHDSDPETNRFGAPAEPAPTGPRNVCALAQRPSASCISRARSKVFV